MKRLAAGDRVSEYVLLEKVGEGGFGEVWKARHHEFAQDLVAVKLPTDPAFAAQLRLEGRLQHDLANPHIVRTIGLDPVADPPYFVMEWVEGESLRDALRRRGRLAFPQALEVAAQVAEGLAHAHARGVVHRDVKPENVLITWSAPPACADEDPRWRERTHRTLYARVADFGLGRVTQAAAQSLCLSGTLPGQDAHGIAGTLAYMAPEQKRGVDSGARADVYALGMLLYEAAAGVPPEGDFRDLSRIDAEAPAAVDGFVRRCLAQAPEDRFADAGEALAALHAIVANGAAEAPPLVFRTGREVRTLRALVEECDAERDDALRLFRDGEIESWLRRSGEATLARRAGDLREKEASPDAALEKLLVATGQATPPRLEVDLDAIDVHDLPRGGDRRVRVLVTNAGRGWLSGEVTVPEGVRWVRPSTVRIEGNRTALEVCVVAEGLELDHTYATVLSLRTNGGERDIAVKAKVVPRGARLSVRERRYWVVARGRRVTLPIAVENEGDMLLSASVESTVAWISAPSGDVTIKGARDVEVTVDTSAAGATEEAPASGLVRVHSNGGEATVKVSVGAMERSHPLLALCGATLAYVAWLPSWTSGVSFLGLCTGAWIWGHATPARTWGLTEAIVDGWTRRRRLSWLLAGAAATIVAEAIRYAR